MLEVAGSQSWPNYIEPKREKGQVCLTRGAFLTPFRVWYRGPNWQLWAYCRLCVPKWQCAGCLKVTGTLSLSFPI